MVHHGRPRCNAVKHVATLCNLPAWRGRAESVGIPARIAALRSAGCEVWQSASPSPADRLRDLLRLLGDRRLTNLLVEGGPHVLQEFFAAGLVDEVWQFTAPCDYAAHPAAAMLPVFPEPPPFDVESVSHPGGDTLVKGVLIQAPSASEGIRSPYKP